MMQTTILDYAKLSTITHRVSYIYDQHQRAIDSDVDLIFFYNKYFGATNMKESTIQRTGRKLRQKFPNKYIRSEESKEIHNQMSQQYAIYYARS